MLFYRAESGEDAIGPFPILIMKKLSRLLIIIGIGLFLSNAKAEGADWRLWYKNTDGLLFYYDTESISPASKDVINVTGKVEGTEIAVLNPKTKKIDQRSKAENIPCEFQFNCSRRTYRMVSSRVAYEGETHELNSPDAKWIAITPDSFFEPFYEKVCQEHLITKEMP